MRRLAWMIVALASLALSGCKASPRPAGEGEDPGARSSPGSPEGTTTAGPAAPRTQSSGAGAKVDLVIAYGSEKKTWLEEQAKAFESSGARIKSGKSIHVDARAMGSGEAVQSILSGEIKPHVFSPASGAYVAIMNRAWLSQAGHTSALCPAGEPVVLSPLVIAMWKPMAEALGWPKKALGWKDLLSVNANPKGWGAQGHPEWGPFKLGHTHPEFSNSGLLAILAEAYAGAKKTRGLTADDVQAKATRDFVASVERTIVHYGKSTGFFADKMLERGPSYLSAAVLYENLVIESYAKSGAPFPVVAIYPVQGTFWSDHPYATLDAAWVGSDEREAAQAFLAFLKQKPQQERALALGFRPADTSIPIGAPIDEAHGVDPKQPQTLLEVPDGAALEALLQVWRENKKAADITMVFDKSGSMQGKPLAEAKAGAKEFLKALGARDEVTLLFFDNTVYPPVGPMKLGGSEKMFADRVDGAIASGGTALYEAVDKAYALAMTRARSDPNQIHAVVVMTDGKDEDSKIPLEAVEKTLAVEGGGAPVKVFTIGYGKQAETEPLSRIAEAAQGTFAKGSVETIVQVYRDMASFF